MPAYPRSSMGRVLGQSRGSGETESPANSGKHRFQFDGGRMSIAHSIVGADRDGGRPRDDFYPTDPKATKALLEVEQFSLQVWEPACGNGAMAEVLKDGGYSVYATDLNDRGYGESRVDFLMSWPGWFSGDIITNPPFKLAQEFVEKALQHHCNKVAIFGRLMFLESKGRKPFFESTPLARVWVFSERISSWRNGEDKGGGKMTPFAWYVWDKDHTGPPALGWL